MEKTIEKAIERLEAQADLVYKAIREDYWMDRPSDVRKENRLRLLEAMIRMYSVQMNEYKKKTEAEEEAARKVAEATRKEDDYILMLEAKLSGQRVRMGRI